MNRICLRLVSFLLVNCILGVPSEGFSQNKTDGSVRKHTLNFDDELIEGGVQKPELMYLLQRKNFNFKKLIRLREHFLPEMVETGELLRGARRKD